VWRFAPQRELISQFGRWGDGRLGARVGERALRQLRGLGAAARRTLFILNTSYF
jgi:hypothetical protein